MKISKWIFYHNIYIYIYCSLSNLRVVSSFFLRSIQLQLYSLFLICFSFSACISVVLPVHCLCVSMKIGDKKKQTEEFEELHFSCQRKMIRLSVPHFRRHVFKAMDLRECRINLLVNLRQGEKGGT